MIKFFNKLFTPQTSSSSSKFSLQNLNALYQQLIKNEHITDQNAEIVIETLRSIAEVVVWGDQHNPQFFEFFLEKNILSYFLNVLKQNCSSHVKRQLIQTLSIMIQNINDKNALYFLMSNNHINALIIYPFNFEEDEELLAYYITFLKTISMKLDKEVIQFFFNHELKYFPLYTESIKFINFPENMVRTAVRTITLNIFSVADKTMQEFILNQTAENLFTGLSLFVMNEFRSFDEKLLKCENEDMSFRLIEDCVADHLDDLFYINDILNVKIEGMDDILIKTLIKVLFEPFLLRSILNESNCEEIEDEHQNEQKMLKNMELGKKPPKYNTHCGKLLSPKTAMFYLTQFFTVYNSKSLIEYLSSAILNPTIIISETGEEINNPFRGAILKYLTSPEESIVCSATALLYSIVIHKVVPFELLVRAGLVSRKLRKTNRLLNELLGDDSRSPIISDGVPIPKISRKSLQSKHKVEIYVSLCVDINESEKAIDQQVINVQLLDEESKRRNEEILFEEKGKVEYPFEIVQKLLEILPKMRRICSVHLIIRMLLELLSPTKGDPPTLYSKHGEILAYAVKDRDRKVNSYVNDMSISVLMNRFENEFTLFKKLLSIKSDTFLSDSAILFDTLNEEFEYDVEYHRRMVKSTEEIIKNSLHMTLLLKHLHYSIECYGNPFLNSFFNCIPKFAIRQQIVMNNRDVYRCNIIEKTSAGQTSVPRYLFFEDDYLYVISVNLSKMGYANVRHALPLLYTNVEINPENQFTLFLKSEKMGMNGVMTKIFNETLLFDDSLKCREVKKIIDSQVSISKQFKLEKLKRVLSLELPSAFENLNKQEDNHIGKKLNSSQTTRPASVRITTTRNNNTIDPKTLARRSSMDSPITKE